MVSRCRVAEGQATRCVVLAAAKEPRVEGSAADGNALRVITYCGPGVMRWFCCRTGWLPVAIELCVRNYMLAAVVMAAESCREWRTVAIT